MYIHVCTPICTCTYTYISLYTHSVSSLHHLLETIATSQLCSGNADGHFLTLPNIQKGVLKDMSSEFHCKLIYVATLLNQTYNYFSPGSKVVAVVDSTRTVTCLYNLCFNTYHNRTQVRNWQLRNQDIKISPGSMRC